MNKCPDYILYLLGKTRVMPPSVATNLANTPSLQHNNNNLYFLQNTTESQFEEAHPHKMLGSLVTLRLVIK